MYRAPVGASRGLRGEMLSLATALAALALASAPSQARSSQKLGPNHATDNPRYAAIVVDANSGATLRQASADSLRHPASLTKIMTLYLLFERIESGKLKLYAQLPVSEEAASQAPTKLGLKPGQTIAVEDAIKALITKSANDAAVVIAEALAGSEGEFATLMTRKARALGMNRTVYRNASGLPDDDQVTTARDQARLGILIQDRFPRYYRYFAISNFTYHGDTMRNHNRLLGRVAGVDGIKTGYTRASGFNLVTSVRRGARHIVAVVMGGNSGAERDAQMRDLIDRHIVEASVKREAPKIAQAPAPAEVRSEARAEPRPEARAVPRTMPRIVIVPVVPSPSETAAAIIPPAVPGSSDPINPTAVKTVPIRAGFGPLPFPHLNAYAPAPEFGSAALESSPLRGPSEPQTNEPEAPAAAPTITGNIGAQPVATELARPSNRSAGAPGGWAIQVGAFEQEGEARHRLNIARSKAAELLGAADPYTERTTKGEKTFYRARFAGFDRTKADAACKLLQQNDMTCLAIKL